MGLAGAVLNDVEDKPNKALRVNVVAGGGGSGSTSVISSFTPATVITVGTTPVELKVGISALANRIFASAQPVDNKIYWGSDNTVSPSTGFKIFKSEFVPFDISPTASIFLVAAQNTSVVIIEGA